MDAIKEGLTKLGFPASDAYDLPSSPYRFPDGAHFRIEIPGIENLESLEAMVNESEKRKVTVHRLVVTVGGATLKTFSELRDMAQIAADKKYECIINPMLARRWDTGKYFATPAGAADGSRIRGMDNIYYLIKDIERCIEAGFRGFLIYDEGLLWLLSKLRENGTLPKDIIFKVSSVMGHGSPVSGKLLEELGADTFNPLPDLTFPMLAAMRKTCKLPLDIYVSTVATMGGMFRFMEAAEIARLAAPCYFKFEPGRDFQDIYRTYVEPSKNEWLCREKVRQAEALLEWVDRMGPDMICSKPGVADLVVPKF